MRQVGLLTALVAKLIPSVVSNGHDWSSGDIWVVKNGVLLSNFYQIRIVCGKNVVL